MYHVSIALDQGFPNYGLQNHFIRSETFCH